jgi:hypothetical protein
VKEMDSSHTNTSKDTNKRKKKDRYSVKDTKRGRCSNKQGGKKEESA